MRHPSFATPAFYDLARRHNAAIVYANGTEFLQIDEQTSDFTYARLMSCSDDHAEGATAKDPRKIAAQARSWAKRGDVFIFFIAGAKARNPAAAMSLIREMDKV